MDSPSTGFPEAGLSLDLRQAVCCLAEALNLVGIDERQHGERVACMAAETARQLGWQGAALTDLFHAAVLHDCGVSSTRVHSRLINDLDWEGAERHCRVGEAYIRAFRPLAHLAPVIRWHHSHWDDLSRKPGVERDVALASNLVFLADRADALLTKYRASGDREPFALIRERLGGLAGSYFAPELVDAFMECSKGEAFWLALEPLNVAEYIADFENPLRQRIDDPTDQYELARIFAHIVDAKSPYTYQHSRGVAALATHLARAAGIPEPRVGQIEIAGLLHDLGKLGVPDEILEYPGPMNQEAWNFMHRHSYDSYRILHRIQGMEEIAEWAGCHHETLLGDGYPFHYGAGQLPQEARIVAVADVFQALSQDRPYRKGMAPEEALSVLREMNHEGKLDREVVALVAADLEACYRVALPEKEDGLPWL